MTSGQQEITREVLHSVHDFLGGPTPDGDEWCFDFGEPSEIWDTQGQFEAFGERLMPILTEAGIEMSAPR